MLAARGDSKWVRQLHCGLGAFLMRKEPREVGVGVALTFCRELDRGVYRRAHEPMKERVGAVDEAHAPLRKNGQGARREIVDVRLELPFKGGPLLFGSVEIRAFIRSAVRVLG